METSSKSDWTQASAPTNEMFPVSCTSTPYQDPLQSPVTPIGYNNANENIDVHAERGPTHVQSYRPFKEGNKPIVQDRMGVVRAVRTISMTI